MDKIKPDSIIRKAEIFASELLKKQDPIDLDRWFRHMVEIKLIVKPDGSGITKVEERALYRKLHRYTGKPKLYNITREARNKFGISLSVLEE